MSDGGSESVRDGEVGLLGSVAVGWAGEELHLLPERAVWWPAAPGAGTLFVADLHLGKGDVFRANGIPIPSGTTRGDLNRLGELRRRIGAERVVILGDFFHGRASQSHEVRASLRDWRASLGATELILVRGNHDRRSGDPPAELDIRVVEAPFPLGPFALRHEPAGARAAAAAPGAHHSSRETTLARDPGVPDFEMAGHLHPAVRLEASRRERIRMPCFWFTEASVILPAFGSFTGGGRISPGAGDRVFVVADDGVLEVPVG